MSHLFNENQRRPSGVKMFISNLVWFLVGLGTGTAVTLLYAPQTGKKTRRELSKNIESTLDDGQDAIEPVVKRLEKEISELRSTLEDQMSKLR